MTFNPFEKSYSTKEAREVIRSLYLMPEGATVKVEKSDQISHRSIRSALQSVCDAIGMKINTKRCVEGFLWIKRQSCVLDRLKNQVIELFEWGDANFQSYPREQIARTMRVNPNSEIEMMILDEAIKMTGGEIKKGMYLNMPGLVSDEN